MRSVRTPLCIAYRRKLPGFTLAEVLLAIFILLVGVVAALKIFPPGFNALTETQRGQTALPLIKGLATDLTQNPDALPDAICPSDMQYPTGASANAFAFFNDLRAVDWQASGASWYARHLYPTGSAVADWPLWEPPSVRTVTWVQGERVMIPSEMSRTAAGSAVNVAFFPKYFPRFGPIISSGYWDGAQYVTSSATCVAIYDLRYRRVNREQLENPAGLPADHLCYAMNARGTALSFLSDAQGASVRCTFFGINNTGVAEYVPPTVVQLPAPGGQVSFTTNDGSTITATASTTMFGEYTLTLDDTAEHWRMLVGSEQLNRAYQYSDAPLAFAVGSTQYYQAIANLASGQFYLELPPAGASASQNIVLGAIFFSRQDAGRTVKMDYTVADWNILHEDVTVDDDGYVTLMIGDPKIYLRNGSPREPSTWGLYRPMAKGTPSVVMGVVDIRTGMAYHVVAEDPGRNNPTAWREVPPYSIVPASSVAIPTPIGVVDLRLAEHRRFRLGGGTPATPAWASLRGQTFRVYYRARHDWTVQVYRPPAMFWAMRPTASMDNLANSGHAADMDLGWNRYASDAAEATPQGRIAVPGVFEGQSVAVDYQYRQTPTDPNSPLLRASGELYMVPAHVARKRISIFRLRHVPAPSTAITVRGMSVTVRALWAQPRSGEAYVMADPSAPTLRTIAERWQQKAITVIIPMSKE